MKKTFTSVFLMAVLAGPAAVQAQRDNRSHEENVVTTVGDKDANASEVESTLKKNAPSSVKDNGLPRFAIVGKDNHFYLGIGAQFLGEGVFDWADEMPSALEFTPSSITARTPGNGGATRFAWQSSSFYMNIVALPGSEDQIGLFFKANFTGADNGLHLSHAYVKYRGLTVGYTHSLFTDDAAEPFTIDDEGPNGYPSVSNFTAYWEQAFTKGFSGAIGIDSPNGSITTGVSTAKVNQRIPAVPMYLQYAWNGGDSHIRLSGLIRPIQYRDMAERENKTIVGGGVQLSGMTNIVGGLSAQFNAAYGKGIGSYLQDDEGLDLDATTIAETGKIKATTNLGLTGGLTYKFSPKVSSNIVYSHLTNWFDDKATGVGSDYRYGDYFAANVVYAVNKFVSMGIEYDYGHRKSVDGVGLHTNRVQCQFGITF